jgi:hypothetical protein
MSSIQRAKSNPGVTQPERPQEIPIDDPEEERRVGQQRGWTGHLRYLGLTTRS